MLYPVELRVRSCKVYLSLLSGRADLRLGVTKDRALRTLLSSILPLPRRLVFVTIGCPSLDRPPAQYQAVKNKLQEVERVHKSSTRRYARYRTELPLIVKVLGQEGYLRIHGRCFEIAENGLGAVVTSEFRPGEMVSLELSIPKVAELQVLRAVVRHRMGFLHGFEFVGILPDQASQIRSFCRTLPPG